MDDFLILERCIRLIEQKLNWGPSNQWTAFRFTQLSQEIYEKTSKSVSDSTLKRIFGKKDNNVRFNPQVYTKNALALYLGFKDWESLCISFQEPGSAKPESRSFLLKVLVPIPIVLTIIILFVWNNSQKEENGWLRTDDSERTVPFTATFHYDISKIDDSVFIDFGYGQSILLPKERNTISEFYKTSGVYYPKIFTRRKSIDSVCLINYSTGWQGGYSRNDDYRSFVPIPDSSKYLKLHQLYISPETINEIDPVIGKDCYAEYRLVHNWGVSLDSVYMEAELKNSPEEGGKLCYDTEIWLIGTINSCRVRFVEPGCYRYGQLQISEKRYNGRFDNLKSLERNLKNWKRVSILIQGNMACIYFDNHLVIKEKYIQSLGKFIGVYFRFFGTGSVHALQLKKPNGNLIYQKQF